MARDKAGRKVTGKLIQDPETGYWREEKEPVKVGSLGTEDVLQAFRDGASRPEIARAIAEATGVTERGELSTIHRKVGQVTLDAGIREREETSRAAHHRDPDGEADLPALLEEVAQ